MASPRPEPYVWVTWITKLLAGEANCQWSAWFRAHYTYQRAPSDFDLATWTAEHAALVRARAAALQELGYEVTLEGQNSFRLRGREGTVLSGKPDIVAVRGKTALVIDCKTGVPKASDHFQVMTYMLVLPICRPNLKPLQLEGEIQYRNDIVKIPAAGIDEKLKKLFRDLMHTIGAVTPPPRVPCYDECRYCDITDADCPKRVETAPVEHDVDLF